MYSLALPLQSHYSPNRFCAMVRVLNERAALSDLLHESNLSGRPYVGFNGLVLSQSERDRLTRLTETFNIIMTKAMGVIVQETPSVLHSLGWPENLTYPLRHEPLNRHLTPIGRFDFALDTAGEWRLMEFNSDTPSGVQEVTLVEQRQWPYLARVAGGKVARLNPSIDDTIARALYEEALFAPSVGVVTPELAGPSLLPVVGFLVQGRHLTDLAQVDYYAQALAKLGLETVVGDISNFNLVGGQFYLLGKPVDALFRLFPVEYLSLEPVFAAFLQSVSNGWLKSLNNLRGFLAQSKAVMAWVWGHRNEPLFSEVERETIEGHLPPTFLLEDLPESFDYRSYIIKEFYGREGAEVYNGAGLSCEGWLQCREWRTFVAQQRIEIAPVEHLTPAENWSERVLTEVFPCVGSYIMGGKWGGCYTRVGERITNSFAQFVPTLVEV